MDGNVSLATIESSLCYLSHSLRADRVSTWPCPEPTTSNDKGRQTSAHTRIDMTFNTIATLIYHPVLETAQRCAYSRHALLMILPLMLGTIFHKTHLAPDTAGGFFRVFPDQSHSLRITPSLGIRG